jgi:hypothetical protein
VHKEHKNILKAQKTTTRNLSIILVINPKLALKSVTLDKDIIRISLIPKDEGVIERKMLKCVTDPRIKEKLILSKSKK